MTGWIVAGALYVICLLYCLLACWTPGVKLRAVDWSWAIFWPICFIAYAVDDFAENIYGMRK